MDQSKTTAAQIVNAWYASQSSSSNNLIPTMNRIFSVHPIFGTVNLWMIRMPFYPIISIAVGLTY